VLGCALVVILCVIQVNKYVAAERAAYVSTLSRYLEEYMAQQTEILRRLAKNLIPPLKDPDTRRIAMYLSAHEEILFGLAKQGLVVPLSLQLVSLDVPLIDSSILAPDESYYIKVVEQPKVLTVSRLYNRHDMPDYLMVNLGLGIVDGVNNYHGHLDAKLAVASLSDYLVHKPGMASSLFTFKFVKAQGLQPEIILLKTAFAWVLLKYMLACVSLLTVLLLVAYVVSMVYNQLAAKKTEVTKLARNLETAQQELAYTQAAIEVQNTYGVLLNYVPDNIQVIELQQLLLDIKTVNANLAFQQGVKLLFPEYNSKNLRFYGHQIRLMQILSGILHEMIKLNALGGTIELKVDLSDNLDGQQKLKFHFMDNGFYDSLQDRELKISLADIRCKGWGNILRLIALEEGVLEHVHTAYVGNSISCTVLKKLVNNVVNLENFV